MVSYGVPEASVFLRSPTPSSVDRYDFALLSNGHVQARRIRGGTKSVLADVSSGITALDVPVRLAFSASGSNPVTLTGFVDGAVKLSVVDSSSAALDASGYAGIATDRAGVWFDSFKLTAEGPTAPVDAGFVDAGPGVDPATSDAGPAAAAPMIFSDSFSRTSPTDLGASWGVSRGLWLTRNLAVSDRDGANLALASGVSCAHCKVEANVFSFGVPEAGLAIRTQRGSDDRYVAVLLANRNVQVRRIRSGASTSLGEGSSGLASLDQFSTLALATSGASPVSLQVWVNGQLRLTLSDSSPSAISSAGRAGLSTASAGV